MNSKDISLTKLFLELYREMFIDNQDRDVINPSNFRSCLIKKFPDVIIL